MRAPISWLREYAALPDDVPARDVAERLIAVGLEVETVDAAGSELAGPLVIGRVQSFEEEAHSNGKTVRWCQVDVGEPELRGIVCGARNFAELDLVVVALPGAVLPGGFEIGARKTYGHVSDGMICSQRELGIGDEHTGIWVVPDTVDTVGGVGDDAVAALGLRDDVLDIAVTPDRGYALSLRGVARECAAAFGVGFTDPVVDPSPEATGSWPVEVEDPSGCDRFVIRSVSGLDASASSPHWMQQRLRLAGMRPISLAVDVTNYVMLETGQPLHAYDRKRLSGAIVVRRAAPNETLRTLDDVVRQLDADDLLITDASGPIGLAGVMGGASTEINDQSTDIVVEAAHFDPATISRMARRHKLASEASRRFARGVDTSIQEAAAERAVSLLNEFGRSEVDAGRTVVGRRPAGAVISFEPGYAARLVGVAFELDDVRRYLDAIGCVVDPSPASGEPATWTVTAPSWRPDLTMAADLVEEVVRQHGYGHIPATLPPTQASSGLTASQRARRRVGVALAGAGYVETPSYPFVAPSTHDALRLPPDDPRRQALRVANPLSDEEPELRTSLLPGLLETLRRNLGRGADDVAIFEIGSVYRPDSVGHEPPRPVVTRRPTPEELEQVDALLPRQPRRVAVALAGDRERAGWWGPGRAATWGDAIDAAQLVADACGVRLEVSPDEHAPWHPGRCAVLRLGDRVVGHAGELHPQVVSTLGLPLRSCAMELELDAIAPQVERVTPAPRLSTFPVAKEDLALVVADDVPAQSVADALMNGGGDLVESVRLFDIYTGEQVGPGKRSLAFALRLRADDRTLTPGEVTAARESAVAEAARITGAVLRS
jgi:phenylalanyl-tRNA synthetase beta chain